eukprot:2612286-Amphidinium_carterae.1
MKTTKQGIGLNFDWIVGVQQIEGWRRSSLMWKWGLWKKVLCWNPNSPESGTLESWSTPSNQCTEPKADTVQPHRVPQHPIPEIKSTQAEYSLSTRSGQKDSILSCFGYGEGGSAEGGLQFNRIFPVFWTVVPSRSQQQKLDSLERHHSASA